MRIASFNVENLFERPKAMDPEEGDAADRSEALAAQAEVAGLLDRTSYAGVEDRILELLGTLGVLHDDEGGRYVRLRKLRGQLLRRPRDGDVLLIAHGRGDWVGWVELKTIQVQAAATDNTARVIDELDADVMTVVEADDRPGLMLFSAATLLKIGGRPYEQVMVVEGNDQRGIDVGILARSDYPLREIRTHVFDEDDEGVVFSRDCCEYHLDTPRGQRLVVVANHFKSKGYSSPGDPIGAKRRTRQARRVAQIYQGLLDEGIEHIAITGDLNDDPDSAPLQDLLSIPSLTDISEHGAFQWNGRLGTYGSGNRSDKIDYILMSDALFARATGGGVFRKGVWHGPRTTNPWEMFPTLQAKQQEASDHAAVYADLNAI
jgi:endonuclease/exonuclease/phosphatase family metal-dependent hydrolase